MKHIKLFENKSDTIKITIITFESGEFVSACYIDGFLEFSGDDYHNKIDEYTDGFIRGLMWFKQSYTYPLNVEVEYGKCINDEMNINICELGHSVPKELKDIEHDIHKNN